MRRNVLAYYALRAVVKLLIAGALIKGAENFRSTQKRPTRYINERSERNELNELRWERSVTIKVTDGRRFPRSNESVKDR